MCGFLADAFQPGVRAQGGVHLEAAAEHAPRTLEHTRVVIDDEHPCTRVAQLSSGLRQWPVSRIGDVALKLRPIVSPSWTDRPGPMVLAGGTLRGRAEALRAWPVRHSGCEPGSGCPGWELDGGRSTGPVSATR